MTFYYYILLLSINYQFISQGISVYFKFYTLLKMQLPGHYEMYCENKQESLRNLSLSYF